MSATTMGREIIFWEVTMASNGQKPTVERFLQTGHIIPSLCDEKLKSKRITFSILMNPLNKKFKIPGQQIQRLIPNMGGCYASDRITVDGESVGYMYREKPSNEVDSGWRFFAGDETQEYADMPNNFGIYEVNTICNYDPAIIPFLDSPLGTAFGRAQGTGRFEAEELAGDEDAENHR